ncbi:transposase [Nannocystis sp.]|uniref:IS66 family transposase n=1 Tax=Nannocystis sp. TaxID=1962667 RepID=UPI0025CF5659|nr:transposase [Nannocystis sp.]MBK7830753.1 transposase [Nannocystis sp.]
MDPEDARRPMEPPATLLLEYILGDDVIGVDETHWRLMQPGSTAKWWVWCLTTHDAVRYMLEPSRPAKTISRRARWLRGRAVCCDAYPGYLMPWPRRARAGFGLRTVSRTRAVSLYELRSTYPDACGAALDLIDPIFLIERELPSPHGLEGEAARCGASSAWRVRRDGESRLLATKFQDLGRGPAALPRSTLAEALGYLRGTGRR